MEAKLEAPWHPASAAPAESAALLARSIASLMRLYTPRRSSLSLFIRTAHSSSPALASLPCTTSSAARFWHTTRTLLPSYIASAAMFTISCDLPVPGGPLTTVMGTDFDSSITMSWLVSLGNTVLRRRADTESMSSLRLLYGSSPAPSPHAWSCPAPAPSRFIPRRSLISPPSSLTAFSPL